VDVLRACEKFLVVGINSSFRKLGRDVRSRLTLASVHLSEFPSRFILYSCPIRFVRSLPVLISADNRSEFYANLRPLIGDALRGVERRHRVDCG